MDFFNVSSDNLFVLASSQNAQRENSARSALADALDLYSAKDYKEAIKTFNRAVGLSPKSETAIQAFDYMAKSYLELGDTEAAIATYQKSLRVDPKLAETHISLGSVYLEAERYSEAQAEYEKAVRIDPGATNRFFLGQAYLQGGRYDEAMQQFAQVRELTPDKHSGNYGIGLVYAKQGRSEDAIKSFERALTLKPDFWDAYAEMGYVYADKGDFEQAMAMVEKLKEPAPMEKAPGLASLVEQYVLQKQPPKMEMAYSTTSFIATLSPGTTLASLGAQLVAANSQKTFAMNFQFSKEMDPESVEAIYNWSISRSISTGRADGYNYGLPLPSTEVSLPLFPDAVVYDREDHVAIVFFTLHQNATADGTIDPSHVQFSFNGQDMTGLSMDPEADQYTGFSGFA